MLGQLERKEMAQTKKSKITITLDEARDGGGLMDDGYERLDGMTTEQPFDQAPWTTQRFQRFVSAGMPGNLNTFPADLARYVHLDQFESMPREMAQAVGVFSFARWTRKALREGRAYREGPVIRKRREGKP